MAKPWSDEVDALLDEYARRFHDIYFHFGETYPDDDEKLKADIQHWLDIGKPRPWTDFPEDVLI